MLPDWRKMEKLGPFDVDAPPSAEAFAQHFRMPTALDSLQHATAIIHFFHKDPMTIAESHAYIENLLSMPHAAVEATIPVHLHCFLSEQEIAQGTSAAECPFFAGPGRL